MVGRNTKLSDLSVFAAKTQQSNSRPNDSAGKVGRNMAITANQLNALIGMALRSGGPMPLVLTDYASACGIFAVARYIGRDRDTLSLGGMRCWRISFGGSGYAYIALPSP